MAQVKSGGRSHYSRAMRPLSALLPPVLALLVAAGCGGPGGHPTAPVANPRADRAAEDLMAAAAQSGRDVGVSGDRSYRISSSGSWRVLYFDPPLRSFRIQSPEGVDARIVPPTRVAFFSEGKRTVILRPEGAARMAFHFELPEGLRPRRRPAGAGEAPIHFPGADVWVFREGQVLELEWTGRKQAGWLGTTPCYDSTGARVPVTGSLHLPPGWVGVPSGSPIFRIGRDRVYGPFAQVRPGLWTSTEDPYPLAVDLHDGLHREVARVLGPPPRQPAHVVIESCGACPRGPAESPVLPAGESDGVVSWVRLGSPGIDLDKPGPLQTQTLQSWIPVEDGDPTGLALVTMYARALFPMAPMAGLSFLPPPSIARPLDLIRTWRLHALGWEYRALASEVLPGVFFESRQADPTHFDQVVRELVARRRAPEYFELVHRLRAMAPACLAPLSLRGLTD